MGCPPPLHAQALARGPLAEDCTEQAAPQPPPPSAGGGAAANAGSHLQPPAASQDNSNGKLLLPQLDRLHLAFKWRQVSPSVSSSSQDQQAQQPPKSVIPKACHGAAHQALVALQGPASALRRHALQGAAPASPATETQGHGP